MAVQIIDYIDVMQLSYVVSHDMTRGCPVDFMCVY